MNGNNPVEGGNYQAPGEVEEAGNAAAPAGGPARTATVPGGATAATQRTTATAATQNAKDQPAYENLANVTDIGQLPPPPRVASERGKLPSQRRSVATAVGVVEAMQAQTQPLPSTTQNETGPAVYDNMSQAMNIGQLPPPPRVASQRSRVGQPVGPPPPQPLSRRSVHTAVGVVTNSQRNAPMRAAAPPPPPIDPAAGTQTAIGAVTVAETQNPPDGYENMSNAPTIGQQPNTRRSVRTAIGVTQTQNTQTTQQQQQSATQNETDAPAYDNMSNVMNVSHFQGPPADGSNVANQSGSKWSVRTAIGTVPTQQQRASSRQTQPQLRSQRTQIGQSQAYGAGGAGNVGGGPPPAQGGLDPNYQPPREFRMNVVENGGGGGVVGGVERPAPDAGPPDGPPGASSSVATAIAAPNGGPSQRKNQPQQQPRSARQNAPPAKQQQQRASSRQQTQRSQQQFSRQSPPPPGSVPVMPLSQAPPRSAEIPPRNPTPPPRTVYKKQNQLTRYQAGQGGPTSQGYVPNYMRSQSPNYGPSQTRSQSMSYAANTRSGYGANTQSSAYGTSTQANTYGANTRSSAYASNTQPNSYRANTQSSGYAANQSRSMPMPTNQRSIPSGCVPVASMPQAPARSAQMPYQRSYSTQQMPQPPPQQQPESEEDDEEDRNTNRNNTGGFMPMPTAGGASRARNNQAPMNTPNWHMNMPQPGPQRNSSYAMNMPQPGPPIYECTCGSSAPNVGWNVGPAARQCPIHR